MADILRIGMAFKHCAANTKKNKYNNEVKTSVIYEELPKRSSPNTKTNSIVNEVNGRYETTKLVLLLPKD